MKRNDIRRETALIIRKDGEYLQGRQMHDGPLIWSLSAWDAWRTRDRDAAERVARLLDAEMWLFNPAVGQLRMIRSMANEQPAQAEVEGDGRSTWWFVCGECHGALDPYVQRCRHCGRRVSW